MIKEIIMIIERIITIEKIIYMKEVISHNMNPIKTKVIASLEVIRTFIKIILGNRIIIIRMGGSMVILIIIVSTKTIMNSLR